MAECIVSYLLEKLSTLLSQKYTQLEGLEKEVQYIMDELESMRGFLINAEAKQNYGLLDAEKQAWIKQVREVAYDMEDAVDEFTLRFAHHGDAAAGFLGYVRHMYNSVKNLRARQHISSKIIDIKKRVKHIASRHERYQSTDGIVETTTSQHQHPIRGHALWLNEADLVGIDKPKSEIISLILNANSHLKAISVVGMGGLGKTTLVRRVYEATNVKNAFCVHAWLTISETLRIEVVLKDLIRQIQIPGDVDSMDADGLRAIVRDFLKEKRYIIVLDDIWRLDHWDSIKYVFPDDDNRSCIVITTRNDEVATTCCTQFRGNVHRMRSLSTYESWILFCRKAFGEDSCPPHLRSIAFNILTKCKGLPLGIVAIGGLLALKNTDQVSEWDMVLRSLSRELESYGKLETVTKTLILSYNDLPYYLKSCLLYIGIFPEDAIVDTEKLAFLWIVEGFVEVRRGMTSMEVAQSYLNELIRRSLIQVMETVVDRGVDFCCVHDLIHEIILSKCREHNILTPSLTPHAAMPKKVRRLVVDDSTCPKKPFPLMHLRSLFVGESLSASSLSIILNGISKLLKVLDLQYVNINTIPKEVFKLSNLTYLNLYGTDVTTIPKSIGKLQNLEYFKLPSYVKELPFDIINLKKLWYLEVIGKAPYKLGGLFSLQYLKYIEADSKEVIQEIGKLTRLRELGIVGTFTRENGRILCSSLEKLTNLQRLYIHTKFNNKLDLQHSFSSSLQYLHCLRLVGPLVKIPDWVTSCHGLSSLGLEKSTLKEYQLESIAALPNLVQLILKDNAYMGNMLYFKAGGFQKLKRLELHSLSTLEMVILEEGTMSDLETLKIDECMLLEELPLGIQYLTKLRFLQLHHLSMTQQSKFHKQVNDGRLQITEIRIANFINGEW